MFSFNAKPIGTILGLVAIIMILFGILTIVSNKKTYYLPEGFSSEALSEAVSDEAPSSEKVEYPTDPLTEIKNPLIKIVKKLGHMSSYFANPQVWTDVYRTSQMSLTDLARENIKKQKEKDKEMAAASIKKPDTK